MVGGTRFAPGGTNRTTPPPFSTTSQRWVIGDSNALLMISNGDSAGDGYEYHAVSGGTLGTASADVVNAINNRIQRIVLAVGTNEVLNDWDSVDEATWKYIAMVRNRTCISLVLPYVVPPANNATLNTARNFLKSLGLPFVDWAIYANAGPYIGADGIHCTVAGLPIFHNAIIDAGNLC